MTEKLSTDLLEKFEEVKANYNVITENIARAAVRAGRKAEDITFLAAVKTVEPAVINYAVSLGVRHIGENRVQELLSKYEEYNLNDCDLHLIGHLQTNKVRQVVGMVSMIQSVDSVKLAKEISKQSEKNNVTTDILLEINIGREENKFGILTENLDEILENVSKLNNVRIKGLMAVPPVCDTKTDVYKFFDNMYKLFIDISDKKLDNVFMDYLSMGMSGDYQEAIISGANMVRVGSALFGARIYR